MRRPDAKCPIIGRERALIDGLAAALHGLVSGPPPSRRTLAAARRHNHGPIQQTPRGSMFDVEIAGPDGLPSGRVARVIIELDLQHPPCSEHKRKRENR